MLSANLPTAEFKWNVAPFTFGKIHSRCGREVLTPAPKDQLGICPALLSDRSLGFSYPREIKETASPTDRNRRRRHGFLASVQLFCCLHESVAGTEPPYRRRSSVSPTGCACSRLGANVHLIDRSLGLAETFLGWALFSTAMCWLNAVPRWIGRLLVVGRGAFDSGPQINAGFDSRNWALGRRNSFFFRS
jgi:hypothetical protein